MTAYLTLRCCVSPPIGQALAADLLKRGGSALVIRHLAMREAKIKFSAVALQVSLGNVVIRPDQSALKQAEERLHSICVRYAFNAFALARILAASVIHHLMADKSAVKMAVVARRIRHKVRVFGDLRLQNRLKGLVVNVRDMERTSAAITLDQRENLVFVVAAATAPRTATARLAAFDVAPERLIGFQHLPAAAKDTAVIFHSFAQTVAHEPSRLVSHSEHAVELMAGHALFGRGK